MTISDERVQTEINMDVSERMIWVKFTLEYEHTRYDITVHITDSIDITPFQFRSWLLEYYYPYGTQMSTICDDLYLKINLRYPAKNVIIDISENGICGYTAKYKDFRYVPPTFHEQV